MKNKKTSAKKNNILNLEATRAKRNTPAALLLKDSRKVAEAISRRTCVICNTQKACVNKSGVCSYCFESVLTPEEKKIAQDEAKYKIIKIQVIDERWEK